MKPRSRVLTLVSLLALVSTAWAAGGNRMPSTDAPETVKTPDEQAVDHYNFGLAARDKALKFEEKAAAAGDEKQRMKLESKARKNYTRALDEFRQATIKKPDFYQAHSDLGFAQRKTGDFEGALRSYDRALGLEPGYTPAIEYRAEAYLGLDRIDDAKQAYMELFGADRAEADRLLAAMKSWLDQRRSNPDGVDAAELDAFAGWVSEREEIAGQAASVSRTRDRDW